MCGLEQFSDTTDKGREVRQTLAAVTASLFPGLLWPLPPANVYAALELGVAEFDSAVGGLGGCPFAGHEAAAGNVCSEDIVFMCEEMGVDTGVDLEKITECALLAENIVGHKLPGKVMKAGGLNKFRNQKS